MKKLISWFMATIMIVTAMSFSAATVYGEKAPKIKDWTVTSWYEGKMVEYDGSKVSAAVSEDEAYSGKSSLHIVHSTLNTQDSIEIENAGYSGEFDPAAVYTLTFYVKANSLEYNSKAGDVWGNVKMMMGWDIENFTNVKMIANPSHFTITDTEKSGWKKYETTLTNAATGFKIMPQYKCDFYIDDISLTINGGNNLLTNSDFEEAEIIEAAPEIKDWTVTSWYGGNMVEYDGSKVSAAVSEDEAYSGKSSLHIVHSTLNTQDSIEIENAGYSGEFDPAAVYTLTFYVKANSLEYNSKAGDVWGNVKMMMGWDIENFTNVKMIANPSHFTITDTEKSGWKKYETTLTNAATGFKIMPQYKCDFYIDDISLTINGGYNLLTNNGFEEAKIIETAPEIKEWTMSSYDADKPVDYGNINVRVALSEDEAYTGKRSLHIVHSEAGNQKRIDLVNAGYSDFDPNAEYKLAFYIKANSLELNSDPGDIFGNVNILMGWDYENFTNMKIIANPNHFTVTDTEKAGWKKYETTLTNAAKGFTIVVQHRCDFYIDDISLTADGGTNLLANSSFDKITETGELLPDLTETNVNQNKWNIEEFVNNEFAGNGSDIVKISGAKSSSGKRSMHITYSANNYSSDYVLIHDKAVEAALKANTTYHMTMDVYAVKPIASPDAFYVGAGWTFGVSRIRSGDAGDGTAYFTAEEIEGKPGWKRYSADITNENNFFNIGIQGETDIYIDNITVVEKGGSENISVNGDFETASDKAFTVGAVRIFNGSEEITELVSGSVITAAVTAENYSAAEDSTAQLILCLYDGYKLINTKASEINTIGTDDPVKTLVCDIDIPEITEGHNYHIGAYVWDSVSGMQPLTGKVDYN